METVQKTGNNNQNVTNQNAPSTSTSGCTKAVYISVPGECSDGPAKVSPYQQKFRRSCDDNNLQLSRTFPELCLNSNWYHNKAGSPAEEPMDLRCNEKRHIKRCYNSMHEMPIPRNHPCFNFEGQSSLSFADLQRVEVVGSMRRRGRKRKYEIKTEEVVEELRLPNPDVSILKTLENRSYFQVADNKQAEVVKAAKSLFSKRTRTLYHWMYPTAPKAQLKAAVASSWETLGAQEKEFYISQVLGRFGFPQTNLMVNPQLSGISGIPPLPLTTSNQIGSEETSTAVSTILMSENRNVGDGPWVQLSQSSSMHPLHCPPYSQRIQRRRGRLGRPPGSKNRKQVKENITILKQIREEPLPEEFQDDPELNREFQQFKWTLHLNDDEKSES